SPATTQRPAGNARRPGQQSAPPPLERGQLAPGNPHRTLLPSRTALQPPQNSWAYKAAYGAADKFAGEVLSRRRWLTRLPHGGSGGRSRCSTPAAKRGAFLITVHDGDGYPGGRPA